MAFAVCTSIALHSLAWLWVRHFATLPDLGFEWTLPDTVELGVYDESAAAAPIPAPAAASEPPQAGARTAIPPAATAAGTDKPRRNPQQAEPRAPAQTAAAMSGALSNFSPAGAQLALRLDLDRMRDSPLADDAAGLLAALPDVRQLLDGSDVAPMRDLSRLFLASPDLRRSHVVMAGRYRGTEDLPRRAVDNLARARGTNAVWRQLRGISIAPWYNADETARVLALVGPNLFAITREQDLGRVLLVARTLARRKPREALDDHAAAQALVTMADRELLGFSAEIAKQFVRGARAGQVPDRLELSVREAEHDSVQVEVHAQFTNAEQALAAEQFWNALRERYAAHPLVALIGLDSVLRDCTLVRKESLIDAHAQLPVSRAKMLLGFARDALSRTAPPPTSTSHDATAFQ